MSILPMRVTCSAHLMLFELFAPHNAFFHPSVPSQRYMFSKKTRLKQTARVRCAVSRVSRQRGKLLRTVSNVCEITSHWAHVYFRSILSPHPRAK